MPAHVVAAATIAARARAEYFRRSLAAGAVDAGAAGREAELVRQVDASLGCLSGALATCETAADARAYDTLEDARSALIECVGTYFIEAPRQVRVISRQNEKTRYALGVRYQGFPLEAALTYTLARWHCSEGAGFRCQALMQEVAAFSQAAGAPANTSPTLPPGLAAWERSPSLSASQQQERASPACTPLRAAVVSAPSHECSPQLSAVEQLAALPSLAEGLKGPSRMPVGTGATGVAHLGTKGKAANLRSPTSVLCVQGKEAQSRYLGIPSPERIAAGFAKAERRSGMISVRRQIDLSRGGATRMDGVSAGQSIDLSNTGAAQITGAAAKDAKRGNFGKQSPDCKRGLLGSLMRAAVMPVLLPLTLARRATVLAVRTALLPVTVSQRLAHSTLCSVPRVMLGTAATIGAAKAAEACACCRSGYFQGDVVATRVRAGFAVSAVAVRDAACRSVHGIQSICCERMENRPFPRCTISKRTMDVEAMTPLREVTVKVPLTSVSEPLDLPSKCSALPRSPLVMAGMG
jgi:hypothetical protein